MSEKGTGSIVASNTDLGLRPVGALEAEQSVPISSDCKMPLLGQPDGIRLGSPQLLLAPLKEHLDRLAEYAR